MVPIGGIINWSGAIGNIPANYLLCDGTGGTPDLRNRFVMGAGDQFAVDETGGSSEHDHDFEGDGHVHGPGATTAGATSGPGLDWDGNFDSQSEGAVGKTDPSPVLNPFFTLAFIMRVA